MRKYLAALIAFLLPIIRKAAVQAAADELSQRAYPDTRRPRGYTSYSRRPMRPDLTRRQAIYNVGRAVREADATLKPEFHDVLLVAFDLRGPNANEVHAWLTDNLPVAGYHGDIELDSWWVANDERFDRSDCDSAVFVTKGKQAEARNVLRTRGLSS